MRNTGRFTAAVALAALLAGFYAGRASTTRYQLVHADGRFAWKFDRWTGAVENILWRRPESPTGL